ncbi:MAG: hypothetical protein IJW47_04520, partial [Clostridia bacterium]|nr:hypothetical protein [Clostridia bacterium]
VLQVGNKARGGVVTVTGNTFKNVGSRMIYFVNLVGVESCTVSGNYFYDNTDCVLSDGEEDPTGLKKTSGVYICAGGGTPVIIGENFWENIPVRDSKYISTSAEYSPEEQKTISKE